ESELAKMFGVSRPPIREALSILIASGVIESKQGGGRYVKKINLADTLESIKLEVINVEQLYDLLEMRTIIESKAAHLAANRATPEDIVKIKKVLDRFSKTMEDESLVGSEPDLEFHYLIVKASKNPFLIQIVDNLRDFYKHTLDYSLTLNVGVTTNMDQIFQEHMNTYEAIKEKDRVPAAHSMERHLQKARI